MLLSLMVAVTMAVPKAPPVYNGKLEHFIADLGPSYPCHPFFEEQATWFNQDDPQDNYKAIRDVLEGLSAAGFNGIRLPMWPYSDEIKGEV